MYATWMNLWLEKLVHDYDDDVVAMVILPYTHSARHNRHAVRISQSEAQQLVDTCECAILETRHISHLSSPPPIKCLYMWFLLKHTFKHQAVKETVFKINNIQIEVNLCMHQSCLWAIIVRFLSALQFLTKWWHLFVTTWKSSAVLLSGLSPHLTYYLHYVSDSECCWW